MLLAARAPERAYTIEEIDAALNRLGAGPAMPPKAGIRYRGDRDDMKGTLESLPEDVYCAIQTGERNQLSDGQVTRLKQTGSSSARCEGRVFGRWKLSRLLPSRSACSNIMRLARTT